MITYNPFAWYWLADDGRVFSSARQVTVDQTDATYLAWKAGGGGITRWPVDDAGAQTTASMQAVLSPYGIYADLSAYAAAARYKKETGGITVSGVQVATDDRSKTLLIGTRIAAEADSTFTTPWVGSDGVSTTLNATQIVALSNAVLAHVQACFVTYNTVVAALVATPPTITTTAQIDSAFEAVTA